MTFMLVDRSKTGFARYCPTIAKAYAESRIKRQKRREFDELLHLTQTDPPEWALAQLTKSKERLQHALESCCDQDPRIRIMSLRAMPLLMPKLAGTIEDSKIVKTLLDATGYTDGGMKVYSEAGFAALRSAAENGIDMSEIIQPLLDIVASNKVLADPEPIERVLHAALKHGKNRKQITDKIMETLDDPKLRPVTIKLFYASIMTDSAKFAGKVLPYLLDPDIVVRSYCRNVLWNMSDAATDEEWAYLIQCVIDFSHSELLVREAKANTATYVSTMQTLTEFVSGIERSLKTEGAAS